MKYIVTSLAAILLAGCGLTPQGDAIRETIDNLAAKSAYGAAVNARDYLCIHARVGAIAKLFSNPRARMAYIVMCSEVPVIIFPGIVPFGNNPGDQI